LGLGRDYVMPQAAPRQQEARWSEAQVIPILQRSDMGRKTLGVLRRPNVTVVRNEFITSYRAERPSKDVAFGPYVEFPWGGMTERSPGPPVKFTIHVWGALDPIGAARLLVHEAAHVRYETEVDPIKQEIKAYVDETWWAIQSGIPAREGFTKTYNGRPVPNVDTIRAHVRETYAGWYTAPEDRLVDWGLADNLKDIQIDYGREEGTRWD
jgi:hypothetical protein